MNNEILKSSPRDVFMHLLNIAGLYASAASLITLFFQYINVAFPDSLNPYYDPGDSIRWAMASLIIIFPVFLWVSRFLHKDLEVSPEKSDLRIRKWLLHLTLFAAAILIIGDLVTLIYNFLQGELTVPFLLKVLSVLVVAAAVFGYYLYDLKKKPQGFSRNTKIFVWAVIAIATLIVVYGFFVAGSPFKQRIVRFDRQKVSDLQNLQGQIVNYWIQKSTLPNSLDDLRDSISGFVPPQDSQTNESYAYRVADKLSFELCANFNLPSDNKPLPVMVPVGPYSKGIMDNWSHGAGEVCFSRTIDPDLYKPKEKK